MSARIPLHKRLLVRLLITSGLIAVCSVAATAWLAVATTTQALREEQGQALADDMEVLAELSGYAATHPDWTGVAATVRELSAKTGRRIALVTPDRRTVADSAARGTALPPSAAATVDPLRTDTYSERGAQIGGIDPRVVGPYRLTKGSVPRSTPTRANASPASPGTASRPPSCTPRAAGRSSPNRTVPCSPPMCPTPAPTGS